MDFSNLIAPIVGGVLIGVGAVALMAFSGRIAGVSGIFQGLLSPRAGDLGWRLSFVLGIVAGGLALLLIQPEIFVSDGSYPRSVWIIAVGGLLVGFGARLGSGCTSGHGVCGLARLGPRSIVATVTFMATGAGATYLINHVLGGAP